MFKEIPQIQNAKELLDNSFKKTKKIQIMDRNVFFKKKKTIIAKTEAFSTYVISHLEEYVKKFPSIDNLSSFHIEIIDIKIDINKLKKSLGAIDWARKTCQMIYSTQSRSLTKSKNIDFLMKKQQEIFGRISSVVKQVNKELILLSKTQRMMKNFPDIYDITTVVIAGYPNVGKSSVLKHISSAKPEIAEYPFTTKEIFVGHLEKKEKYIVKRIQIIDTPGLLDRPFSERNDIEKQAISALKNLADIIVFIIDASETCGYYLKEQMHLLSQIKKMFNKSYFIIVENKADIKKGDSKNLKISCETGEGIDILIENIFKIYKLIEEKKDKDESITASF